MSKVNSDDVREHVIYDPETGKFAWRSEPGTVAGNGYRYIKVKGKMRLAHRMAWAIHYGEEPDGLVDHINGNRLDNRISNLRIATYSQNSANAKRHVRNTSGLKGVSRIFKRGQVTGRWQASITVRNKQMHLGSYSTREEAHAVYLRAAQEHHGDFANSGGVSDFVNPKVKRDWLSVASPSFGA